ncbi:MAG: response regulator transcription factor [Planctomycetota bacterium]|jgi:DNA-binding NarL/FixJ family response regulator
MTKQPVIVERQSGTFVNGEKPDSELRRGRLNRERYVVTGVKQSEADGLLENTLVSSVVAGEPLTKSETRILQSILAGKTNKQIARMLCRSRRTIEYHRNRLMRKLNAHSAAELVKQAIAMGIA